MGSCACLTTGSFLLPGQTPAVTVTQEQALGISVSIKMEFSTIPTRHETCQDQQSIPNSKASGVYQWKRQLPRYVLHLHSYEQHIQDVRAYVSSNSVGVKNQPTVVPLSRP